MPLADRRSRRSSNSTRQPVSRLLLGAAALATVALSACASPAPPAPDEERFIVQPVILDHQIVFAPDEQDHPSGVELDRLQSFLVEIDADRSGTIFVEGNITKSAMARRAAVEDVIQSTGRRLGDVRDRDLPSDVVAVRIRRNLVLPTSCLDGDGWPTPEDLPPRCINDMNLMTMIENERDLLQGRSLGLAPAAPAGDVIRNYLSRFRQRGPDIDQPASPAPLSPSAIFIE